MKKVNFIHLRSKLPFLLLVFSLTFSTTIYSQDAAAPGGDVAAGESLFKANCAACHKMDAKAVEAVKTLIQNQDDNVAATVKEVVALMFKYDLSFMKKFQMMFSDKNGDSVIIEGADAIWKDNYYQVCTNFYHSNPDLGGYPCWRYDKAVELFNEYPDSISVSLFKDILNATHQEGQFPTLYSNIYNLNDGLVYLYQEHFYDEVVIIDLKKGLQLGDRTYKIKSQFSQLSIKSPTNNSIISSDDIKFIWEGIGKKYQLLISTDPNFSDYEIVEIDINDLIKKAIVPTLLILLLPFFFTKNININQYHKMGVILFLSFIFIHCGKNGITSPSDEYDISLNGNEVSVFINNLELDTTYYWKLIAERNGPFKSESPIYSFKVSND